MSQSRLSGLAARLPAAILVAVATYYAVWGGEYSAFDLRRLRVQELETVERLAAARAEVDSLRKVSARLEKDPVVIEAVARERFGMIREGELLYRFVPVEPEAPATDTRLTGRTP